MKKVITIFSKVVIVLFVLSLFGWMVNKISKGDHRFGILIEPVRFMYSFPDLVTQLIFETSTLPLTYIETPEDFEPINRLTDDLVVLYSYSDTNDSRSIVLRNLRNDSLMHKWTIKNPHKEHDRIINPILMHDKRLVYSFDCVSGLKCRDSASQFVWRLDSFLHHHSMNFDADSNLWICAFEPVYYATGMYHLDSNSVFYLDDYITKVDPKNGKVLYHKSVTDILTANNLQYYLLKSSAPKDPMHINDIEPAFKTTKYYKKDDLFISFRNMSVIMQYRPSTDKVIRVIEGPFMSQHDVDFYNDSTLVFFNNNYYTVWTKESMDPPEDSTRLRQLGNFCSNIVRYDLWSDSLSFMGEEIFRENQIFTETEGLIDFINDTTVFVEEQNTGLIWVLQGDEVIYKNVYASPYEGYHHLPNWTRIIKGYD